ncbi:hypothetical protein MOQ_006053 [Trypanosoma cruzi marinkellei]|uniref:Uncharacterized protein n=1 Tax=Trypanosoma cruzi marinkellei TaxID=85056 RepID=K2NMS3_TRYCR|nr:hypothetical protein MOQ_006053 [Trypanosoma cruzi marinkellei]
MRARSARGGPRRGSGRHNAHIQKYAYSGGKRSLRVRRTPTPNPFTPSRFRLARLLLATAGSGQTPGDYSVVFSSGPLYPLWRFFFEPLLLVRFFRVFFPYPLLEAKPKGRKNKREAAPRLCPNASRDVQRGFLSDENCFCCLNLYSHLLLLKKPWANKKSQPHQLPTGGTRRTDDPSIIFLRFATRVWLRLLPAPPLAGKERRPKGVCFAPGLIRLSGGPASKRLRQFLEFAALTRRGRRSPRDQGLSAPLRLE